MSGSRSKKSEGKYDDPKASDKKKPRDNKADDVNLGTGMADKAKKDLQEIRDKHFPDPNDY